METNTRSKLIFKEVRHVPAIRLHFISICRQDDDDYCNIFNDGQWKLTKVSLLVAWGKKCSSLYLRQVSISINFVNAVESNKMSRLWHKLLSHISEKELDVLEKRSLLLGLEDVKLHVQSLCGSKTKKSLV